MRGWQAANGLTRSLEDVTLFAEARFRLSETENQSCGHMAKTALANRRQAHPAPDELGAFVEEKLKRRRARIVRLHVESCQVCAQLVERMCSDWESIADVDLKAQMGAALERFAPVFRRIDEKRKVARRAHRRQRTR
jgi:hypothetical protein